VNANAPYYDRLFNKRTPDGKPIGKIRPEFAIHSATSGEFGPTAAPIGRDSGPENS
jgi:hypothetical protein